MELLVVDVDEVVVVVCVEGSGVLAGRGRGLAKAKSAGALGELVVVYVGGVLVGVGIVMAMGGIGGLMMLSRSDSSFISWILLFSSFLM